MSISLGMLNWVPENANPVSLMRVTDQSLNVYSTSTQDQKFVLIFLVKSLMTVFMAQETILKDCQ